MCVGLAMFVGGMIQQRAYDTLIESTARKHEVLAQKFMQYVWLPYYPDSRASNRITAMLTFRDQAMLYFQDLPVDRVAIIDHRGNLITKSVTDEIRDSSERDIMLSGAQEAGEQALFHRQIDEARIGVTNLNTSTVYESIIRFENPNYRPTAPDCQTGGDTMMSYCYPSLGSMELVTDISEPLQNMKFMQYLVMGSILGIFLTLIAILYFVARRAEAIISKQHENNEELVEMATAAESKSKDKSDFLANISHELRTPLNAIIGFSDIIRAEAMQNLPQEYQGYINDIHSSGSHLLTLINDILDFSKAEAGKLELDLNTVDISKLIVNSMRLMIPRAEEAQITLNQDLPGEPIECITDGKKLKQVLLNLLSNAVKFTPAGGEVRVSMWQKITDKTVHIEVTDTGIGIAPKDIAKVMAPFGQVDSKLSRKYEGTGLGLPLSKKFIEIMGGSFTMASEVNVGTRITIVLPPEHTQVWPPKETDTDEEADVEA